MKKFTTGETNLIKKYNLEEYDYMETPNIQQRNRFSGEMVLLNTFGFNLYNKINNLYSQYELGNMKVIQNYDRLRYLFIKLFPREYMILLD